MTFTLTLATAAGDPEFYVPESGRYVAVMRGVTESEIPVFVAGAFEGEPDPSAVLTIVPDFPVQSASRAADGMQDIHP